MHFNLSTPSLTTSTLSYPLLPSFPTFSQRFAIDPEYRKEEFQTIPEDRPLVAHFSANNPSELLAAAKLVEDQCDAIDLNLGCPQRIAHAGHFGSYLLDDVDRALVLDIVRTVAKVELIKQHQPASLSIPFSHFLMRSDPSRWTRSR